MNNPASASLCEPGFLEKVLEVATTDYVVKLAPADQSAKPVKYIPRRRPTLKSIVLFEKVNSFRREKKGPAGPKAKLDL